MDVCHDHHIIIMTKKDRARARTRTFEYDSFDKFDNRLLK
jgi:hypothetical protein